MIFVPIIKSILPPDSGKRSVDIEPLDRNPAGKSQIKLMRGIVYEGENYFIIDSGGFGGRYIFGTSGVRSIFVKGCEVNGGSQGGKWRND